MKDEYRDQAYNRNFFKCFLKAEFEDIDRSGELNSLQSLGPLKVMLNWCLEVRVRDKSRLLLLCLV